MTPATKNRSLISIIVFLLITNIAMLVFFLVTNNPAQKSSRTKEQNGMSGMLQKEVGFSKEQLDTYQSLRKNQFDTLHDLFDQLRKSKMDFYNLVYSSQPNDSLVNKAADAIADRQRALDLHMFNHFKMVRDICTPGQLPKFDSTIQKVFIRMTGRTGREHPHK